MIRLNIIIIIIIIIIIVIIIIIFGVVTFEAFVRILLIENFFIESNSPDILALNETNLDD